MENKKSKERGLSKKFTPAALSFARLSVLWLGIILVLTIFELIYNGIAHQFPKSFFGVLSWAFFNDLIFWFKGLIYFFVIFVLLHLISGKLARITYSVFIVFMALVQ